MRALENMIFDALKGLRDVIVDIHEMGIVEQSANLFFDGCSRYRALEVPSANLSAKRTEISLKG